MVFPLKKNRKPLLTQEQRLALEIAASTPKPGHDATYAEIADEASQKFQQRAADQGIIEPLQEAATDVYKIQLNQKRRKALLEAIGIHRKIEGE